MVGVETITITSPWYAPEPPILLGESPIYRASDSTLHWIDFISSPCRIFILPLNPITGDILGTPRILNVPLEYISVIRFRKNVPGSYICAYSRGIAFLDEQTGEIEVVKELVSEEEKERGLGLNDGGVDPQGRFWVGGLDLKVLQSRLNGEQPPGVGWKGKSRLWVFEESGKCEVMAEDVICGNGMGWSPDGKFMYFNDSGTQICWKYEFDGESGKISKPSKIIDGLREGVLNDGMIVDKDGNIWVAMWNDHCVKGYTPEGKETKKINLPVKCVTCPAWVGKNSNILVIASAQPLIGKAPHGDLGGHFFQHSSKIRGMPNYEFAG